MKVTKLKQEYNDVMIYTFKKSDQNITSASTTATSLSSKVSS
jgi:hypothetical protein